MCVFVCVRLLLAFVLCWLCSLCIQCVYSCCVFVPPFRDAPLFYLVLLFMCVVVGHVKIVCCFVCAVVVVACFFLRLMPLMMLLFVLSCCCRVFCVELFCCFCSLLLCLCLLV